MSKAPVAEGHMASWVTQKQVCVQKTGKNEGGWHDIRRQGGFRRRPSFNVVTDQLQTNVILELRETEARGP